MEASAKRPAPRHDGPLTHFNSPRGETCRPGMLHGHNTTFLAGKFAIEPLPSLTTGNKAKTLTLYSLALATAVG
ncbi:MAG: hypothetical protein OXB98_02830 [Bryobacterales bacterium]|nr:hypothetical protein [Bryobacterales bacterium]